MATPFDEKLLKNLCKQHGICTEFAKKVLKEAPESGTRQWIENQLEAEAKRVSEENEG